MFELRCNQSEKVFTATDDHILLIGSAAYCQCRLPSVQRVEAVIVRYCEGWVIHELQGTEVKKNGQLINDHAALSHDDNITLGDRTFTARNVGVPTSPGTPVKNQPCQLTLLSAGGLSESHEATEQRLIGTSLLAGIRVPEHTQCKPKQCLLTVSENNWYLIDLTNSGGLHNQQRWQGIIRLVNADTVQVRELKIQFGLHPSSCKALPDRVKEGSDTRQLRNVDTQSKPDPVVKQAQEILNKVRALHMVTMRPTGNFITTIGRYKVVPELAKAERRFVAGYKQEALTTLAKMLYADPWNRQLLLSFARMCDAGQMHHLCLNVLNALLKLDRENIDVLKSIARTCMVLSEDEPRFSSLSIQYWEQVRARAPGDSAAIDLLIRNISAKQAIRRNQVVKESFESND